MAKGEYFKQLPTWAKGLVAVAVVGGVGFIGYKIYKRLNQSATDKANVDIKKETESEYQQNIKTLKPSFPASQYPAMANQIYEGMRYCVGDDYGSVRDTLMKLKNDLDVNLIVKAFGTRQAYCFGIPAGEKKDLFTFVRSELGSEYGGITSYKMDDINKDWAKKGIKYRF